MIKFILPIYYEIEYKTKKNKIFLVGLNWYRNAQFFLNNKVKQHYKELVSEQYNGEKYDSVEIIYKVYQKRSNTDGHNIRSILEKYALDALVDCGMIVDDSTPRYVRKDSTEYYIDNDNPRIEIEIYGKN